MKAMIVGGGGREHALAWGMKRADASLDLIACPGNGGMEALCRCERADVSDIRVLERLALQEKIDLAVVGPEAPLAAGIVDAFEAAGLKVFGPRKSAAKLETSKVFAKEFMRRNHIPTADFEVFEDYAAAIKYLDNLGEPPVVKADGLAQGKGSVVAGSKEEAAEALRAIMVERRFAEAGERVVLEKRLAGEELSVLVVTDGRKRLILPPAQDHKPVLEGDRGPNTGGMGAYAPVGIVDEDLMQSIEKRIIAPTLEGMLKEGNPYRGVLYFGLILTSEGPSVIEYNCRFGDPETQAVLPSMDLDLPVLLQSVAEDDLSQEGSVKPLRHAVCVVIASGGYPGKYETGKRIEGLREVSAALDSVHVFHAGTTRCRDEFFTSGGRVLGVTGVGEDFLGAVRNAYEAVRMVRFEGMYYRKDIGYRELDRRKPTRC